MYCTSTNCIIPRFGSLNTRLWDLILGLQRTLRPTGAYLQIVAIGDYYQLPPVVPDEEALPTEIAKAYNQRKLQFAFETLVLENQLDRIFDHQVRHYIIRLRFLDSPISLW